MRIGEVAQLSGFSTKTIRFYEEMGLIRCVEREPNGYRNYGDEVLTKLEFIRNGRAAGLPLSAIGQILDLRTNGIVPCTHVIAALEQILNSLDLQIMELQRARLEVAMRIANARDFDQESCNEEDICSILSNLANK
ncbi:MAG: MerR family transcriptional regulator [Actinomycetota bacterium]|nr:MerR family transcriptional regulator [Actinomycetota bacterium]